MIDSTVLGAVVDECAAGSAELVVEGDRGGEAEEALKDALSEAGEGSGSVALEREDVLAGPEDRLDPLADRGEVWSSPGLVFAARPDDRGVEFAGLGGELFAGVALIADHGHCPSSLCSGEQFQRDFALVELGAGQSDRPWCAVWGAQGVQPETPEVPAVAGAVPVVGGVGELGALDRLAAAGALHRRGVDEQQLVFDSGALAGEHAHQPLQRVSQTPTALEIPGLGGDSREQVAQMLGSDREE